MAISQEDIFGNGEGPKQETFMDAGATKNGSGTSANTSAATGGSMAGGAGPSQGQAAGSATGTSAGAALTATGATPTAAGSTVSASAGTAPNAVQAATGATQGAGATSTDAAATGVENVRADRMASVDAPKNPTSARDVVKRDVVKEGGENFPNDEWRWNPDMWMDEPKMSYVDMWQLMNPYKYPTEKELEAERKKQKRRAVFAAIGDGIYALSNLYFTTKYAPNSFDPSKSMTAKTRARWDKMKGDWEKNQREYMNGYMRAVSLDEARGDKEREWGYRKIKEAREEAKFKYDQEIKKADNARKDALNALELKIKAQNLTKAQEEAERAKIQHQYEEEKQKAEIAHKKAQTVASYASANASRANVKYHHFRGKAYLSEKDYTKDVVDAARAYNERNQKKVKHEDGNGNEWEETVYPIKTTKTDRFGVQQPIPPEMYAGQLERLLEEEEDEFNQYKESGNEGEDFSKYKM